jgi:hypothetical protein
MHLKIWQGFEEQEPPDSSQHIRRVFPSIVREQQRMQPIKTRVRMTDLAPHKKGGYGD